MLPKHQFDPDRLANQPYAEARFIIDLAHYQDAHQMRDQDFVREMGELSLSLWRQTRSGKLVLGFTLLMGGSRFVSHPVFEAARASLVERASTRTGRPKGKAA